MRILLIIPLVLLSLLVFSQLADSTDAIANKEQVSSDDLQQPVRYDLQPVRKHESKTWLFYTLLVPVLLFVYVSFNFRKDVQAVWVSFFNYNLAKQLSREQETSFLISGIILSLNALIVLGHFAYFLITYFALDWGLKGVGLVVLLTGLLAAGYMTRYWLLKIQAWIFPFKKELNFYSFQLFLAHKVLGMIFLPLVICLAFFPDQLADALIWPTLLLFLGVIAYRYLRAFQIGSEYLLFNKFHFLLYLCTAEVAPAILILKALFIQELL